MSTLLAVDPGARHPAVASFVNGVLTRAERIPLPGKFARLTPLARASAIAREIDELVVLRLFDRVVIELPQVYARGKSKGDPNDLILLAAVCGAVAARCTGEVVTYRPREWAGNIPKATTGDPWESPRGRRIWSRLADSERAGVEKSHDAVDAAGIGLFDLGRLTPRRVFPGAVEDT